MQKSTFFYTAIIVVAALGILAFTLTDHFSGADDSSLHSAGAANDSVSFANAFVARNPPHGQPGHRHDLPDGAPLPLATAVMPSSNNLSLTGTSSLPQINLGNTSNNAPSANGPLNPAHGQPGHRCDIAVGAPLNGAAPLTSTTPTAATAPTPASTALNPAHGQPGHRCDIAVGAPLNSAPAKAASSPAPAASTVTTSTATSTAKGLNPPHGQPGHRCDIAVGAPLTSTPAAATTTTTVPIADPSKLYPFPTTTPTNTSQAVTDSVK